MILGEYAPIYLQSPAFCDILLQNQYALDLCLFQAQVFNDHYLPHFYVWHGQNKTE